MKKILLSVMGLSILLLSCKKIVDEPQIIYNAVTDLDGNTYDAVQIGSQVWMAENLKTTTVQTEYGDTVKLNPSNSTYDIFYCTLDGYAYPWGKQENKEVYGLLYRSEVVGTRNATYFVICPDGWHLPDSSEWETLKSTVAKMSGHRKKIAAYLCGNDGWEDCNYNCAAGNLSTPHRNFTGFSALAAGDEKDVFRDEIYRNRTYERNPRAIFWAKGAFGCWALNNDVSELFYVEPSSIRDPNTDPDSPWYSGPMELEDADEHYRSVRCVKD